jgi:hypothetical protein
MTLSRKTLRIAIPTALLTAATVLAWAQSRKPGLWEVNSTMTWQQSPMPGGGAPPGGGPHTTQVCITQAQIDKFGTAMPQTRAGCQISNVEKTDHSMSAVMTCAAPMTGTGTIESSWDEPDHSKSKVHFKGSLPGQSPRPIEWTIDSTATFKSTDCGSVKPIDPPVK